MIEQLADGVYLGLPMDDYLADDALSGSRFFKLLTEAGLLTWESAANPLWEEGEAVTRGQLRGSACHSAILEGLDAYAAAFCVAPEGALRSGDDMSAWLKRAKEARPDMSALKVSGKVAELRARIEEARALLAADDPLYPVFFDEQVGGRRVISAQDDAYVRLLAHFVRSSPDVAPLISGGLAEVTIVLTLEGVRYKCRLDYMTAGCDLDLKSYGRGPNIDQPLRRHLIRGAFYNGAHLQAVHNARLAAAAGALVRAEKLPVVIRHQGEAAPLPEAAAAQKLMLDIFAAREAKPPVFRWVFVRMDGPPSVMRVPFRQSDGMWSRALEDIDHAVAIYRDYVRTCAPGELWLTDHGEQEIADTDWPIGAWEGRI